MREWSFRGIVILAGLVLIMAAAALILADGFEWRRLLWLMGGIVVVAGSLRA